MSTTPAAARTSKPKVNNIVNNNAQVIPSKDSQPPPTNAKEFVIRLAKNDRKKHHLMRFNGNLNVDFTHWKNVKLERENNMKEFRGLNEDMPRFGAGSEYNRDLREEARRKKFGIIAKKYNPEAQPWILNVGGKSGKKYKGMREGGVGENAAFYVFAHAPDGAIEAYPVNEWYNFQPIQRYKSLSAEEAEKEFARREKVMNLASIMVAKRRKDDEEEHEDPGELKSKGPGRKGTELKISDMDELIDSDDDSDSDEEDKENKAKDSDDDGRKKKTKKSLPEKKKKRDLDDEAFEESDDGDEEGRELDYISDSSEDEPDPEDKVNKELKSVAEEDALRKLLTSDEDEDEEEDSEKDEEEQKKIEKENKDKEVKDKKRKKLKKKRKQEMKDSSSDSSSDSSDTEAENNKNTKKEASGNNSKSAYHSISQVNASKRKAQSTPTNITISENSNDSPVSTLAKKPKLETQSLPFTLSSVVNVNSKEDYRITEDAVRRYLMRKPVTTTELLAKFKNKATGISSEQLVDTMTKVLKKINPVKQTIQGKMYLSM